MILCSGVFDGLHIGHVAYLAAAFEQARAETCMVAVAPDAYVQRHKDRTPIWPEDARATVVLMLGFVDRVVLHGPESVADVILDYHPRLFVKGLDWQDKLPDDVVAACQLVGCEVQFVDSGEMRHTSDALSPRR